MRISDWSSDVCSSDLPRLRPFGEPRRGEACRLASASVVEPEMMLGRLHIAITVLARTARHAHRDRIAKPLEACGVVERLAARPRQRGDTGEIGRASGRERVCQYG